MSIESALECCMSGLSKIGVSPAAALCNILRISLSTAIPKPIGTHFDGTVSELPKVVIQRLDDHLLRLALGC